MTATGKLRELVEVQQETRVSNGRGGYTTSWAKMAGAAGDAWAEIIGLSGDEALQAGVQRSVQQWRVTIRRRDDLTAKHRLLWGALKLDIRTAMPDPKDPRAFTLLLCESGLVVA